MWLILPPSSSPPPAAYLSVPLYEYNRAYLHFKFFFTFFIDVCLQIKPGSRQEFPSNKWDVDDGNSMCNTFVGTRYLQVRLGVGILMVMVHVSHPYANIYLHIGRYVPCRLQRRNI